MSRISFILLLFLSISSFAADPEPYLKSAPMPFYPPLCRTARIEGKVILRFVVNEQGDTSEIEALSGHKMLQEAASQNLQSWKFAWPHPCACRIKREVSFIYSISNDWVDNEGPASIVKWFGISPVLRVEIQAGARSVQP